MKFLKKIFSEEEFPYTITRFFLVGILLFLIPLTRSLFIWLIPWVLLISLGIMLGYHRAWNFSTLAAFLIIVMFSFMLEMYGVSDERIFGKYTYLGSLGIKINDTPVIIGLNWLMLVYGSAAAANKFFTSKWLRMVFAAIFMVIYDILIEIAAPVTGMWKFESGYPPFRNFASWFLAALVFNFILFAFRVNTKNRYARIVFLTQSGFFLVLGIYIILTAK